MSEMEVPKGWKNITFADIVKNEKYAIKRGPWGSSIKKDFFVPDGYKVYQQHNVIYDDFEFGDYFLDEKKFDELKEFEIKHDDILISCSGTIGKIARVPPNMKKGVMNQALLKISPDDLKINPDFFLYLLKSPILQNKIMAKGTAMKNIVSVSNLKKISFNVPIDLKIQKQIVIKLDHILGELDVKKNQILSLIEQNKKRINFFEKNWMSYVIDREIEKHPKRKEWELKKLGDLTSRITKGIFDISPNYYVEDGIPFLRISNLQKFSLNLDTVKFLTPEKNAEFPTTQLHSGDIVLAKMDSSQGGKVAIIPKSVPVCNISQNLIGIKIDQSKLFSTYFFYFLQSNSVANNLSSKATGTSQKMIRLNIMRELEILLPSLEIQEKIVHNIKNAEDKFKEQKTQFEKIKQNYDSKINYINHIQSSILDSAFSGKLLN